MKKFKSYTLISLLALALMPTELIAQAPYFHTYRIDQLKTNDNINCIMQGKDQFIRLGTSKGLFTFDGINFSRIPANGSQTGIKSMYESSEGIIWYGTSDGQLMVQQGDSAIVWQDFEKTANTNAITAILEDSNGLIWVSTYGNGLFVLTKDSCQHLTGKDGIPDPFIYTMVINAEGRIMVGSDAGIQILERKQDGKIVSEAISAKDGLPDNIVQSLALNPDGTVWVGTHSHGICQFHPETKKFIVPAIVKDWQFETITTILPLQDEVWIGTNRRGIINLGYGNEESLQHYNEENAFNNDRILTLFQDKEGNIWVAGSGNQISRCNKQFTFIEEHEGASFKNILAITGDRSGNIWFSNQSGLYRHSIVFNGNNKMERPLVNSPYTDLVIISLLEDNEGFIWAGTFDHGVLRIDPNTGNIIKIDKTAGLTNNTVIAIGKKDRNVWLATLGGVSRLSPETKDTYRIANFGKKDGLGNNYVFDIKADTKGRIWFATDGSGLTVYDGKQFQNYSEEMDSLSQVVYSIAEDKNGLIWFSTPSNGIYTYNEKDFDQYVAPGVNVNKQLIGLTTDLNGNVVSVSLLEIGVIDINNKQLTTYGKAYGIYTINPQFKAFATDKNGNIWIGGQENTILITRPVKTPTSIPYTILTGVDLLLKPMDLRNAGNLSHKQNHLTFNYVGLWYQNPEAVHYRYKLEGYDREWILTGDRQATYSSLPPGAYTFRVQSSHTSSFDQAREKKFELMINPPFWSTTWFIVLVSLSVAAILLLVIREREKRLKKHQQNQREKLSFQLETLRSQVNPHFLFNSFNTLLYLIDENKTASMKYVENLSRFFRDILQYRDQNLIDLREEVKLSENYLYLQKQRYTDNLNYRISIPEEEMQSQIPPMTLQLLFENALKHNIVSRAQPLTIDVIFDNGYLRICNNLQLKQSQGTSTKIGLENIRKRFSILTDQPVIVEESESKYCVAVPLIDKK